MAESAMPSKSAGNVTQMADQSTQSVESSPKSTDSLMDFIRTLGYVPPENGERRKTAKLIRKSQEEWTIYRIADGRDTCD